MRFGPTKALVLVIFFLIITCSAVVVETGKDQGVDKPVGVTLCLLKEDPGKYNHKLVNVTGFFSRGFENATLSDPTCDDSPGIWYDYGGKQSTGTMYCCGVTPVRKRAQQISVENISIPLVEDNEFKKFDDLLMSSGDSVVRATVIGRFFSGEKSTNVHGEERWLGYGHAGMHSLLVVQQVIETNPRERSDLDYRASADQPSLGPKGCGYRMLLEFGRFDIQLEMQKEADGGTRAWAFDDPKRVAIDVLARLTRLPIESITTMKLKRQSQGRMIFEWQRSEIRRTYMVVLSKPYKLSFYAGSNSVAWVPIAVYESYCD